MSKILIVGDVHLGLGYPNNSNKWFPIHKKYFEDFLIPLCKVELKRSDIIVFLGDIFDNRSIIPIDILNYTQYVIFELSKICPIHIILGNHDMYHHSTGDINSLNLFSFIPNVFLYTKPTKIEYNEKSILMMPYIEKKKEQIEVLNKFKGCDYLFCHSDLNGAKMHLTSVAHKNTDKIDAEEFSNYKIVKTGHIHIRQKIKNIEFVGNLFEMDRNDLGNQKGITILNTSDESEIFIENNISPKFLKINIKDDNDITHLETLDKSKYFIDLYISNSLLINNRKCRRKLEKILESGGFTTVDYIDDILKENEIYSENISYDIKLDYNDIIINYIEQNTNKNTKDNIIKEFKTILDIYEHGK